MVVDDSALVRRIATDVLSSDSEITVAATAANAEFALAKLERERPDVITLDLEMPGMGGLEAIRRIMDARPTPIIVMSAHAQKGADLTLQALEAGAVDFVLKPSNSLSGGIPAIARELTEKVRDAARIIMTPRTVPETPAAEPAAAAALVAMPAFDGEGFDLVAIGTSTGGPVALKTVLTQLPGDFPAGVVVVQHMPPVFTKAFADRLASCCAVKVKEAENGDAIMPGRVLIAPGNWHMTVTRSGIEPRVLLNRNDTVNGHRPSVDVLMHSVAREYGARALGVIMTGMGKDGAEGLRELRERGGRVIAQDQGTSVIYGMNKEVVQNGDANEVVPVDRIAVRLRTCVRGGSAARSGI
jgi:two-component system chemotaxis response regulator CheB